MVAKIKRELSRMNVNVRNKGVSKKADAFC